MFAASTAFLPDHSFLTDLIKSNYDFLYALCAAGLGLSLFLIHIYVTEIKRTLQLFWGLGVLGSLATSFTLAEPAGQNLVQYVADHPTAVWLVGPLFAAFTGLVFKEGNFTLTLFVCLFFYFIIMMAYVVFFIRRGWFFFFLN